MTEDNRKDDEHRPLADILRLKNDPGVKRMVTSERLHLLFDEHDPFGGNLTLAEADEKVRRIHWYQEQGFLELKPVNLRESIVRARLLDKLYELFEHWSPDDGNTAH